MAELGMRVGCELFSVFYHVLHSAVGSVGGSVVDVDRLEFDIEGGNVAGIEPNYVFPDYIDLRLGNILFPHRRPRQTHF